MKNIKIFLVILAVTLMSFDTMAQKLGHVNSQEILLAMPETQQMQTKLEAKKKDYATQLESMYKEYDSKRQDVEENGSEMMEAILEAKLTDLQSLQQNIQKFENKANKDLLKLEEELSLPILEKARSAIETVADQQGYTYVFDLSTGAVVHYPEANDITALVKSSLGIN